MKTIYLLLTLGLVTGCLSPQTKIHNGAYYGNISRVEEGVLEGGDVNKISEVDGKTAIENAVEGTVSQDERVTTIEFLLSKGADINLQNSNGVTALAKAVSMQNKRMIEFLLSKNADPNVGKTKPLFFSKQIEHSEMLIQKGANVKLPLDESGNTVLHQIASSSQQPEKLSSFIKFLISKGANVNAKNKEGNTPLHSAAESGNTEIIDLLFANNAKIEKNKNGQFPGEFLDVKGINIVTMLSDKKAENAMYLNVKLGGTKTDLLKQEMNETTSYKLGTCRKWQV